MKVYVVVATIRYEGSLYPSGVFSTEGKAEEYIKLHEKEIDDEFGCDYRVSIIEYELDGEC